MTPAPTYLDHKLVVELAERQPQDFKPGHKRPAKAIDSILLLGL